MINAIKAEIFKFTRRRSLVVIAPAVLVAAVAATIVVFLSAESGSQEPERGATLQALSGFGGGTEAFSLAVSYTGLFVFVLFAANWAGEFSQGTFRTLLMGQPRRPYLLAGKFVGLLAFAAALLLAAEAASWLTSLAIAPSQDVSTSDWFSVDALGAAAGDYGNALFGIGAWACFGMALGVLLRSTPLALAIGIGWAGPFEHITQDAWSASTSWYPGLLLERLALGGTSEVSYAHALTFLVAYVALAAAIGIASFTKRDVAG
jgi:ABC-2 type transport system permease protein